ncbi:MAG TPA: pyruvate carboxylase, partial [Firmicutes bacterium]|nr:pyruvate carboxylase [Bacillota bacterium]HBL49136.1 pyruvate carboxylase [Bacillota bacterium]HCT36998.1 pyruvate carboxylase [Bacillota bacterium]
APAQAGPGTIAAPMPGVIVAIKVKPGQTVKRRDVLLTLEAMKMENEILAPKDGVVKEVYVQSGQSVNPQDPLIDLE